MRYGITRLHSSAGSLVELSEEEFALGKRSKYGFMALLDIEEKLDILLENYAEYERELLSLTLQRALFFDPSWSSVISDINTVNRRLANLLTTGRLYIDQVNHEISAVYGAESTLSEALRSYLREEYSSSLGYRAMEALRNFMQHRALPVYQIKYPGKATFSENEGDGVRAKGIRWGVIPSLRIDALREDKKIKASVLNELAGIGEYVPITPLVRQYVEAIGRFHEKLREATSGDLASWREQMKWIIARGQEGFSKDLIGFSLVVEDEAGGFVEGEQVFEDLLSRHSFLTQKNLVLKRFSIQFVTGECIQEGD
jgi:hypothetical protein